MSAYDLLGSIAPTAAKITPTAGCEMELAFSAMDMICENNSTDEAMEMFAVALDALAEVEGKLVEGASASVVAESANALNTVCTMLCMDVDVSYDTESIKSGIDKLRAIARSLSTGIADTFDKMFKEYASASAIAVKGLKKLEGEVEKQPTEGLIFGAIIDDVTKTAKFDVVTDVVYGTLTKFSGETVKSMMNEDIYKRLLGTTTNVHEIGSEYLMQVLKQSFTGKTPIMQFDLPPIISKDVKAYRVSKILPGGYALLGIEHLHRNGRVTVRRAKLKSGIMDDKAALTASEVTPAMVKGAIATVIEGNGVLLGNLKEVRAELDKAFGELDKVTTKENEGKAIASYCTIAAKMLRGWNQAAFSYHSVYARGVASVAKKYIKLGKKSAAE